jgi:type II secretory pathway pseudopilin PulG
LSSRRAFSLIEALVASTLLLLILGSLALLVRSYGGSSRASDAHDSSLAGARLALESLRRDGEAAVKWLEPTLGSAVAEPDARLRRIDPEILRLPETFPSSPPGLWDPYAATEVVEVYYHMVGESLLRQVTFSDASQKTTRVADRMVGFACTSLSDNTLVVRCSILTIQGDPRFVSGRIALRCLDLRP